MPDTPFIHDAKDKPIIRSRVERLLVRNPAATEMTDLKVDLNGSRLEEEALFSLEGALRSVSEYSRDACLLLLAAWRRRRDQPGLIEQPVDQWVIDGATGERFEGYGPGRLPSSVDAMTGNPSLVHRIRAAGLDRK